MQHSYDGLDRPAPLDRGNLLSPLKHRDFRILWMGMAVSLIGDGIFLIAIAWESYTLWNTPASLAIVGIAITVPMIGFLLIGGVISDRRDRRRVMVWADSLRAASVAILAVLALAGALQYWELVALVALYGVGTAFFTPAFEAMVPNLLPTEDLTSANSLDQFVRPIGLRFVGPVVGGALVAVSSGLAFAVDAASFAASLVAVVAISHRGTHCGDLPQTNRAAIMEGLRFVRNRVWLWGTLLSAAIAYLVFLGPAEVLLPYLVKNDLHGSAGTLGLVLAAGGVGAIGAAIYMGRHGHPRRDVTVMYGAWTLATLAIVGYGLATSAWQLMITCLIFNALEAAGTIVWATMKQRHVPGSMLGRVSSLDWLISIALLPLSFALTAPVAAALGVRTTLICAGVVGAAVTFGAYFLPGMRDIEQPFASSSDKLPELSSRTAAQGSPR